MIAGHIMCPNLYPLINWVYSDLSNICVNAAELGNRVISSPTNDEVNKINSIVCN